MNSPQKRKASIVSSVKGQNLNILSRIVASQGSAETFLKQERFVNLAASTEKLMQTPRNRSLPKVKSSKSGGKDPFPMNTVKEYFYRENPFLSNPNRKITNTTILTNIREKDTFLKKKMFDDSTFYALHSDRSDCKDRNRLISSLMKIGSEVNPQSNLKKNNSQRIHRNRVSLCNLSNQEDESMLKTGCSLKDSVNDVLRRFGYENSVESKYLSEYCKNLDEPSKNENKLDSTPIVHLLRRIELKKNEDPRLIYTGLLEELRDYFNNIGIDSNLKDDLALSLQARAHVHSKIANELILYERSLCKERGKLLFELIAVTCYMIKDISRLIHRSPERPRCKNTKSNISNFKDQIYKLEQSSLKKDKDFESTLSSIKEELEEYKSRIGLMRSKLTNNYQVIKCLKEDLDTMTKHYDILDHENYQIYSTLDRFSQQIEQSNDEMQIKPLDEIRKIIDQLGEKQKEFERRKMMVEEHRRTKSLLQNRLSPRERNLFRAELGFELEIKGDTREFITASVGCQATFENAFMKDQGIQHVTEGFHVMAIRAQKTKCINCGRLALVKHRIPPCKDQETQTLPLLIESSDLNSESQMRSSSIGAKPELMFSKPRSNILREFSDEKKITYQSERKQNLRLLLPIASLENNNLGEMNSRDSILSSRSNGIDEAYIDNSDYGRLSLI